MTPRASLGLPFVASLLAVAATASAAPLNTISFTGNGNIQSELVASGPSGDFTTANSFATPFSIPTTGDNFAIVSATDPLSITGLSIENATDVYTLMNAFAPGYGATIGAITFSFSDGSSESINLVSGSNIRDYYDGSYENTTTASYVENAFTYTDTVGGAGTGNSSDGDTGTYVFDEQDFSLGTFAVGKILTGIEITSLYGDGQNNGSGDGSPLVLGVTVEGTPVGVPEPATWSMLLAGFAGLGLLMRRRLATTA